MGGWRTVPSIEGCVMRRRMLNCIVQDCILEEKIHVERLESIMDEKERKKEVQGRGG